MTITEADHTRIAEAIRAAETRTRGEIVCVLAHASSNYVHVPLIWAALLALLSPWPMILFTEWPVLTIFAVQLVAFAVLALVMSIPAIRMALVPPPMRRARAHNAALQQFLARGLTRTSDRCGVLIFVSLAERYARIIADDGIVAKVPQTVWQRAIDGLVGEIRHGRVGDAFAHAIGACGSVLAEHFPRQGNEPNELPDRIYVF